MDSSRRGGAARAALIALGVIAGLALIVAGGDAAKKKPAPEPAVADTTPAPLEIADTRFNVEKAFDYEMNAKELYLAFAKQADLEGYPGVASLFRAVARAEEVHAQRHVEALTMLGGQARAILNKPAVGLTADNLKLAIDTETWDAQRFYPAVLERARAEKHVRAVRSTTFALGCEREHLRLFTEALASLDQRAPKRTFHVCTFCGRLAEATGPRKCPNCFTGAGKFATVS